LPRSNRRYKLRFHRGSIAENAPILSSGTLTPLEKFSFKPEALPKWIQRFERFRKATGLDKQSGENQVNTLIYTMGEQVDDIFISFEFTTEQEKSYEEVKERFENHFIVKRNVIFE